jgi:membrane protease YdiL (CAAX protease family)
MKNAMKKLLTTTKCVYDWLISLPAYYLIPLLLLVQFGVIFLLYTLGIIDMSDKGDASFDEMGLFELIVLACILAPLIETFLFQFAPIEIVLHFNKKLKYIALVLSVLLFALMHYYSLSYMIFGAIMGTICALGYMISRDKKGKKHAYWIVVIMHAIWNTIGIILSSIPV